MVKLATLITLLVSIGTTLATDKCRVVWQSTGPVPEPILSKYPLPTSKIPPSPTSTTTSAPVPPSPTPYPESDACIQTASQLQFVKGGVLSSAGDSINLDIGQAGAAQISNNTFAKSLRKESFGFSIPFSAVPGKPIKTFFPPTPGMVIHTYDYQINFIYSQVDSKIIDIKCHYKDRDIDGVAQPEPSKTTTIPNPSPTPNSKEEQCRKTAEQLQFIKGGKLNDNFLSIFLDLGQAGQAQQSGNPFSKDLRKVASGFDLIMSSIPGNPFSSADGAPPSYTADYEVNVKYSPINKQITAVKCHYKSADL